LGKLNEAGRRKMVRAAAKGSKATPGGKTKLPVAVTCIYAGQVYSEGARLEQAGKTMVCSTDDGITGKWKEVQAEGRAVASEHPEQPAQ
jgi:hypothetical protein